MVHGHSLGAEKSYNCKDKTQCLNTGLTGIDYTEIKFNIFLQNLTFFSWSCGDFLYLNLGH